MRDQVKLPDGSERTYHYLDTSDGVVIVPLKINSDQEIRFILTEQYRYPVNRMQLEFPGGSLEPGEATQDAAARELKEETGYTARDLQFLHRMEPIPSTSAFKTFIYRAIVEGEPSTLEIEKNEIDAGLTVREFSADEILKMVRENEITDGKTIAALGIVLLQSNKALEYATSVV